MADPARRARDKAQSGTRAVAQQHHATWARWELERISDRTSTARSLALELGRTYSSVTTMRRKLGLDPTMIARAPLDTTAPTSKTCTKCSETKPRECFRGTRQTCRECEYRFHRERERARRRESPDEVHAKARAYRTANRDRINAQQRASDAGKEWKRRHPERVSASNRIARANMLGRDPEYYRNKGRAWREANPDAMRELRRRGRPAADRRVAAYQAESLETAERSGTVWTGWELELISDRNRSARELAKLLGRTYAAVKYRRYLLVHDPKTITHAGLGESL